MTLPDRPADWPEPFSDYFTERLAIMETEAVPDAYRKAVADIRRVAGEQGELF